MQKLTAKIKSVTLRLRAELYYRFSVRWRLRPSQKRVLIIKNDSIGDYILFRNFLEEMARSPMFNGYQLYLLTTRRLAPIAQQLDGGILKEILIFEPEQLSTYGTERAYFKKMNAYRFRYVLHPTYSPDSKTQYLVKFLAATSKVGFSGDTANQTPEDKARYEREYTQLVSPVNNYSHEFLKQREFFGTVLKTGISLQKPFLKSGARPGADNTILICPGAQHQYRIWSLASFGQLVSRLADQKTAYRFTVVTGPGEDDLYEGIKKETSVPLDQYRIGPISGLVDLVAGARLVVCNDSSAAHIAVACDTISVCISNGNHLNRFVPYPEQMGVKQKVIFPASLGAALKEKGAMEKYYQGSTLNINEITVDEVAEKCLACLAETKG